MNKESLEIQKNVPLPDRAPRGHRYPLEKLEIGDSFFVVGKSPGNIGSSCVLHRPKLFTCRTIVEKDKKGVRVWRIK